MTRKQPLEAKWFHIAVQALAVVAVSERACPSAAIARDVQAHAVFLRRVLAHLARAGIVAAQEGRAGGYTLARPAREITLAEIFRAVRWAGVCDEEPAQESCLNDRLESALGDLVEEAEQAALEILARYTLADVVERAARPEPAPVSS